MQRLFHRDETGFREHDRSELDRLRGLPGWVWLDMTGPTHEEILEVAEVFGLSPASVEDVVDDILFPKLEEHPGHVFFVWHGLVTGDEGIDTLETDAALGPNYLITFHHEPSPGLEEVAAACLADPDLAPPAPDAFLASLSDYGVRRYFPLLDELEERIEAMEAEAIAANPSVVPEVQALRRDVIVLRRALGPQRDVLRQVQASSFISEPARRGFTDAYDHVFRVVESLDGARLLLGSVLDSYRSAVAERMNHVMQVLTVFSAILLPLGLIAGLYGMNVAYLPFAEERWGIWMVLGLMGAIVVGLWVFFVRIGFIGGPRLRKLPRAVGLGAVKIGVLPFRIVFGVLDQGIRIIGGGRSGDS